MQTSNIENPNRIKKKKVIPLEYKFKLIRFSQFSYKIQPSGGTRAENSSIGG